jgi:anti-anti-sigma regulatory factor
MTVLSRRRGSLVAPPELTIREAEGLKKELLQAMRRKNGRVSVEMDGVERLDTAAAQLLLAARRQADGAGGEGALAGPSDACREMVARLGLTDALFGCAKEKSDE